MSPRPIRARFLPFLMSTLKFQPENSPSSQDQWFGKTTLLRILYCAEKPTSGEVIVNGIHITQKDFRKIYQLRRTMGIVFQDFKLLRDRTVGENIAFALEVTGHSSQELERRCRRS